MAHPTPADDPGAAQSSGRVGRRAILTNSVVALLLGTAITVLLHDLTHWITGAVLGSRSSLFGVGVTHDPALQGTDAAIAAMAGPVVSLLVGTAMQILQPFRFKGDFAHLLWIWIAVTSLMATAVTFVITPFAGDIAVALAALEWPSWVAWVAAAVGLASVLGVAREWAIHSVRLCGHDLTRLRYFSWYPWLIAVPVQVGLAVAMLAFTGLQPTAEQRVVIVLGGLALSVFAPLSIPLTRSSQELEEPLQVKAVPWVGVLGLVILVACTFAISGGVALG